MLFWLIIIALVVLLAASPPVYPYSRQWGYLPFGGLMTILIILLLIWYFAYLPSW